MTKPADAVKAAIDESLAPRLANHSLWLAGARPDPLPVARADLHYIWDDYGNQYLDFASWMHPVGHRHNIVMAALADHQRYYHFTAPLGHHLARWPVQYAADLGEALQPQSEVFTKVLFCEGEREAVVVASTLACHATDRPLAVVNSGWHRWLPVEHRLVNDPADLDPDRDGGLLLAPVDTAAVPIDVGAWIDAARERDIPAIVDESLTGFGRTGPMWGHQPHTPDLTVLGGPVGGSLPLGAVVGDAEFFVDEMRDVSPQAGNSLACAAGASMKIALELGVLGHVAETAPVLTEALDELCAQFPEHLDGHHGTGHLRGLRLRRPDPKFPARARVAGLLVAPPVGDTVVVIAPPLIASHLELKRGVDMLADALLSWDDEIARQP